MSGSGRIGADASEGSAGQGAAQAGAGSGIERIGAAFQRARAEGRAALMPYLMGGFPTLEQSVAIGHACVQAGADVLELGVPYSDPLADGPVIHEAATRALAAGASLSGVLEVARELAGGPAGGEAGGPAGEPEGTAAAGGQEGSVPVVLMCYANMVLAPGVDAFVQRLARTGASGLIVPDLPLEEADATLTACDAQGIALVPLVAPTTTGERLQRIGRRARGFLYTVSVVGTTGERAALSERFAEIVARAKACTEVPVALGFGISTPEHARQAAGAGADGVIVGTRLVRAAAQAGEDPAGAVGEAVAELAAGLRAGALL